MYWPRYSGALDSILFQLKALAVGAFDLGGDCLVGAYLNGVQAAVLGVLAVIGTVVYRTLDALIWGTGTAAIGTICCHNGFLLQKNLAFSHALVCTEEEPVMQNNLKTKMYDAAQLACQTMKTQKNSTAWPTVGDQAA